MCVVGEGVGRYMCVLCMYTTVYTCGNGHPREKGECDRETRKLLHAREPSCPNYLLDGSLYHLDRDGTSMRARSYLCVQVDPIIR